MSGNSHLYKDGVITAVVLLGSHLEIFIGPVMEEKPFLWEIMKL